METKFKYDTRSTATAREMNKIAQYNLQVKKNRIEAGLTELYTPAELQNLEQNRDFNTPAIPDRFRQQFPDLKQLEQTPVQTEVKPEVIAEVKPEVKPLGEQAREKGIETEFEITSEEIQNAMGLTKRILKLEIEVKSLNEDVLLLQQQFEVISRLIKPKKKPTTKTK